MSRSESTSDAVQRAQQLLAEEGVAREALGGVLAALEGDESLAARSARGRLLLALGDEAEGLAVLEKVQEDGPTANGDAWFDASHALLRLLAAYGEHERALAVALQSVRHAQALALPEQAFVGWALAAFEYQALRRFAEQLHAAGQALRLAPRGADGLDVVLAALAYAAGALEDQAALEAAWPRWVEIGHESGSFWVEASRGAFEAGAPDMCRLLAGRCLAEQDVSPETAGRALNNRGLAAMLMADFAAAAEDFKAAAAGEGASSELRCLAQANYLTARVSSGQTLSADERMSLFSSELAAAVGGWIHVVRAQWLALDDQPAEALREVDRAGTDLTASQEVERQCIRALAQSLCGHQEEALGVLDRLEEASPLTPLERARVAACRGRIYADLANLAGVHGRKGPEAHRAIALLRSQAESDLRHGRSPIARQALMDLALILVRLGDLEAAWAEYDRVKALGFPDDALRAALLATDDAINLGLGDLALELCDRVLASHHGGEELRAAAALNRCVALAQVGRGEETLGPLAELARNPRLNERIRARAAVLRVAGCYSAGVRLDPLCQRE